MSQKVRKGVVNEEKEKRQSNSPVKEMKKKMAANAEKEKQAAEKVTEKSDKNTEKLDKSTEKISDKPAEKKTDKAADKKGEKAPEKKAEKVTEKKVEKSAEKKTEKVVEKKPEQPEKAKEESSKGEKSGKQTPQDKDPKPKQNGKEKPHNGVSDVTLNSNGCGPDELNGTVKATRTPETPRPASDKQTDRDTNSDDPKDSKVLKMKEDLPATDRKLRSSDSPKPQDKKQETEKDKQESEKKDEKLEMDVVIEIEDDAVAGTPDPGPGAAGPGAGGGRKPDTNYSKSRVKVSPYRRSGRVADQTASSVLANYTGNNTTMEMDITETSSFLSDELPSGSVSGSILDDSSYVRGLRSIKGRPSYKQLKDMPLRHLVNRSLRSTAQVSGTEPSRPTGTVVGRKRKPDTEVDPHDPDLCDPLPVPLAPTAPSTTEYSVSLAHGKRMRLLDRIAQPFRRTIPTVIPRRNAEIVGINTDLPLTAPVAAPDTFDPESLKPNTLPTPTPTIPTMPTPTLPTETDDRDNKRCIVM